MTAHELVQHRVAGGISHIRLDDPSSRNSLSPAMSRGIATAVADALSKDSRALVLTAEPPAFCSGGSLHELLEPTHPLDDAYAGVEALAEAPSIERAAQEWSMSQPFLAERLRAIKDGLDSR